MSVIVPAYQAATSLRYAVASALGQRGVNVEVLIADDGSTDETGAVADELAERDGRCRVVHLENRGPSAARNAGIAAASGDLLAFLDADDLLLPGYAARLAGRLRADPELGFAFCDAWVFDMGANRFRRQGLLDSRPVPDPVPRSPSAAFEALIRDNFIFVASMVRREALESVGGWDESMRTSEDWDLWLRLLAAGRAVEFVRERLVIYRRSPSQASADSELMATGRARLWGKFGYEPPAAGEPSCARSPGVARRAWSRLPRPVRELRSSRIRAPRAIRGALAAYELDDLWGHPVR